MDHVIGCGHFDVKGTFLCPCLSLHGHVKRQQYEQQEGGLRREKSKKK
jgi:hypothetical protein